MIATEFGRASEQLRKELLVYCYRMLGSIDEAEDVVQDVYLNAWRSYAGFDGRSSLRTWLYRIATNACLRAAERRRRRPLPSGLRAASEDPLVVDPGASDIPWLQPFPTAVGAAPQPDPAVEVQVRQSIRLALVAALQNLSPRQRTVLILREVLQWRAAEVAALLDTTSVAVDSALQRARARLATVAPDEDRMSEPSDLGTRELLDRYAKAFETADIAGLTRLLTADATFEMPPHETWFAGRETVGRFLATRLDLFGERVLVPTEANGQPAFAVYTRENEWLRAHALQVITPTREGIASIVHFLQPSLFERFGLPSSGGAARPG